MIRVYPASKLKDGALWRSLDWPCVLFVARWLKHELIGTPDIRANAKTFWQEDEEDIKACDIVLVYASVDNHLRGALVEAGMGIAHGKRIIVVGQHADYGTWQYHPRVQSVIDLDDAYRLLKAMDR